MKTDNCSTSQDAILSDCESFGGKAEMAAEIAKELDEKLTTALGKIEDLEARITG